MAKRIIPILVVLALAGLAVWHFSSRERENGATLGGSGTIEGTRVEVTSKIAGRIAAIPVREGDRVTAGQVVATLEHPELDQQLAAAQAAVATAEANIAATQDQVALAATNLRHAETEFARAGKLRASGSVSQQLLDQATTARDSLRAQVAAARSAAKAAQAMREQAAAQVAYVESQIANATLSGPIDGIVLTRNLEPGENAFPGASLLSLADDRALWVKVYVSGERIGHVKVGRQAEVTVDSFPDRPFPGQVVYVSPVAEFTPKNVQTQEERVRLVYAVKVAVDGTSGELKIGMPADVEIAER